MTIHNIYIKVEKTECYTNAKAYIHKLRFSTAIKQHVYMYVYAHMHAYTGC